MGENWAGVVIGTILFVVLSPGLLFQLPSSKGGYVGFVNVQTSGISIFVHSIIFFAFITIFLMAIDVYIGS